MKEFLNIIYVAIILILLFVIIIDVILYMLLKNKQKKEKLKQREKIDELQNKVEGYLEEEKETIEEVLKETENENNKQIDNNEITKKLPYSRKMLLTNFEYRCYKALKPLADKYNLHIMSKVRLIDFITVNRGMAKKECYSYIGKIKQSHIDFVFCNPDNLYPIACLELDDSTHKSLKAKERDNFKNDVFESAGIKLYRINNLNVDFEEILREIASMKK